MYVFGGKDLDNNKLNDVWEFNLNTYVWTYIEALNPPLARSGHSASVYKDMMVVFGGIYEVTRELDDLFIYEFKNKRWITLFEEMSPPLKLKNSVHSPDGSPMSKGSGFGKRESFKLEG